MGPPAAPATFSRLYGCKPALRCVVIVAAIVTVAAAVYDDAQVAQIIRAARKDPTLSEAAIMESFAQSPASASVPQVLKEAETEDELALSLAGDTPLEAAIAAALTVPDATSTPPTPRLWIGSHNDTHGDEFPVQHGEHGKWTGPSKFDGKWLNCKTFVSVTNWMNVTSHSGRTCTSCPANQAFIMNFHKSRAGQCNKYTTTQVQKCIKLNENNSQEAFTAKAKLCTKVRLIEAEFNVNAFPQDTPERLFFSSVSGKDHRAVAKCAFRKETVCDDTGTCAEKKQIKCLEVCKMTKWQAGAKGGAWYDSCDATKCKGEHSIWPCREVGMME